MPRRSSVVCRASELSRGPTPAGWGRRLAAWLFACAFAACGSRPPPTPPPALDESSDEERPSIAGIELPPLPLDVEVDDPEIEEGWLRTVDALTMPAPDPPRGEAVEVEAWADIELADWMRRRAEAVAAAQRALEVGRRARPEHSVVASTLLGLAYARFALDVRGIPVPAAFAEDPVRAEAFRNALETATHPLWQRALDAFGSCASVAAAQPAHALSRWRERCDGEIRFVSAMLPDPPPDAASSN